MGLRQKQSDLGLGTSNRGEGIHVASCCLNQSRRSEKLRSTVIMDVAEILTEEPNGFEYWRCLARANANISKTIGVGGM